MSWEKRINLWFTKMLLLLAMLFFFSGSSKAQVWGPLGYGVKGDPVAYTIKSNGLVMVVDNGLNANGRVFSLQLWNGIYWTTISIFQADSNAKISKVLWYKEKLYIAGQFKNVRNAPGALNIIAWNYKTRKFEAVVGMDANTKEFDRINDMEIYDGYLVVAGKFERSTNIESKGLQAYDGAKWNNLNNTLIGSGFEGEVFDIMASGDTLFVTGDFEAVNKLKTKYFYVFLGNKHKLFPGNFVKASRLGKFNGKLYTIFNNGSVNYFYFLNSLEFNQKFSSPIINYELNDIVQYDNELWVSGSSLIKVDGKNVSANLVKYSKGKWSLAPGHESNYKINLLIPFRKQLIGAGADFKDNAPLIRKVGQLYMDKGIIEGRIFFDKNKDCIFNSRDAIISDRWIKISPGPYFVKPDALGRYMAIVPHGTYEINVAERRYWGVNPCGEATLKVEISEDKNAHNQNFALNFTKEVTDVNIKLTSLSGWVAKKGNIHRYNLRTENVGSEKVKDGKITVNFNTKIDATFRSNPKPDSIYDDRVVYLVSSIESGDALNIPFSLELPSSFVEENLEIIANITPSKDESEIEDNETELSQVITDSTYENSKQVFPSAVKGETIAKVDPDEGTLNYLINFSNFSNDTVHTIRVIDTIDANLPIEFIRETGSSHDYTTQVINGPPGSNIATLVWTFNNLNLVPNPGRFNDLPGYSGYIGFQAQLNSATPLGTIIKNRAALIFDYEHTEMTNEVQSEVAEIVSINDPIILNNDQLIAFPNPSDGFVFLKGNKINIEASNLKIYNGIGKQVMIPVNSENGLLKLDFREFASGIYILHGLTNEGSYRKTLIID